ncbi:hypothetical protein O5346_21390 [Enterobacter hormaechei]|nr:hypothetical protein [Enterobacter hormaechei]MCZ5806911.1 hypothetical protein [Enterobacter hormaechei]
MDELKAQIARDELTAREFLGFRTGLTAYVINTEPRI